MKYLFDPATNAFTPFTGQLVLELDDVATAYSGDETKADEVKVLIENNDPKAVALATELGTSMTRSLQRDLDTAMAAYNLDWVGKEIENTGKASYYYQEYRRETRGSHAEAVSAVREWMDLQEKHNFPSTITYGNWDTRIANAYKWVAQQAISDRLNMY